jgi:ubiquitin C-terminal hydrolase
MSLRAYRTFILSCLQEDAPKYELTGIVHHDGVLEGGHYWAQCRSAVDGCWYKYNDSQVVLDNLAEKPSETAYMLMYRRM